MPLRQVSLLLLIPLLATGALVGCVKEINPNADFDPFAYSRARLATTASLPPPQINIAPTSSPGSNSDFSISESTHTLTAVNEPLANLLGAAYRVPMRGLFVASLSPARLVAPASLPPQMYDVQITAPGANAPRLRSLLAQALQQKFGLVLRAEPRETDVYLLSKAEPPTTESPGLVPISQESGKLSWSGSDLYTLCEQLEEQLGKPVLNNTGLSRDYRLQMNPGTIQDPRAVSAELTRQLGLMLVPARSVIDLYRVESRLSPQ